MERKTFYLKKESLFSFFKTHLLRQDDSERQSVYQKLKDEILLKKSVEFAVGDIIDIEVSDFSNVSEKTLIHHYVYEIEEHDSYSVKMVLNTFKVDTK